jgi:hypothetical protein
LNKEELPEEWTQSIIVPIYKKGDKTDRNRSTTDHIFSTHQILQKKWEYNEVVYQLFIDFKKVYSSVRREVLFNILIEFGIPMKPVRLIKMCLSETYRRVQVGIDLSDTFAIKNGLK